MALVTHGLFMAGSAEVLADPPIDGLVVTDTVPPFRLPAGAARKKLVILPAASLLSEAIARLHDDRVLSDLLVL
jgi:ribose-phosphate pyrophosphokinase